MWEQYQFLRYYLPGFLFFIYLAILLIPQLSPTSNLAESSLQMTVGIFGSIIVASPVIGFIVYAPFNFLYEYYFAKKNRPALRWLEQGEFWGKEEDEDKKYYGKKIENLRFIQKKELLEVVYYSELRTNESKEKNTQDVGISLELLNTLSNTLNNFSSRVACAWFASAFSLVAFAGLFLIDRTLFSLFKVAFQPFNFPLFGLSLLIICFISVLLWWDSSRVLSEAYQLEDYFIRAKPEETKRLLKKLFPRESEG